MHFLKKVVVFCFLSFVLFSSRLEQVEIATEITTKPNYLLFLERLDDDVCKLHLLSFCLVGSSENVISYKHQCFFPKNLSLTEDRKSAAVVDALAVVLTVATEEETDAFFLTDSPGMTEYLLDGKTFLLDTAINRDTEEQDKTATSAIHCRLEMRVRFPAPNSDWELLPRNEKMCCFVERALPPLPAQSSKKVFASFFVCPYKRTVVTARMGIRLQKGSFADAKTFLVSLQMYDLTLEENIVTKMEEKKTILFGAFLTYTVRQRALLVFVEKELRLEVSFPLSLLVSEADSIFVSAASADVKFRLNGRKVLPKSQTLCLVEEFFRPNRSFVAEFQSVKMPVLFPEDDTTAEMTLFFPVVEAVCKSAVAEVSFVLMQTFAPTNKNQSLFCVKFLVFELDFSKTSSVELVRFCVEGRDVEFLLPLLLRKERVERDAYKLRIDYNFAESGLSSTGKKNDELVLDFSNQRTDTLRVDDAIRTFVGRSGSADAKYLLPTKVLPKTNGLESIRLVKKLRFLLGLQSFVHRVVGPNVLFYKSVLDSSSKCLNEQISELESVLSNPVPDLYLLVVDCYLHLNTEEQIANFESWRKLLKKTELVMETWNKITSYDLCIGGAELLGVDGVNSNALCSLIDQINEQVIKCCELVERVSEISDCCDD